MPSAKTKKKAKPVPAPIVVGVDAKKKRKKNPPRTAFKKGGPNPHAFQPGESGNPGGCKPKTDHLISRALRVALADRAPDAATEAVNLAKGASWAQVLARRLIHLAVRGDLTAMREIREATEGVHGTLGVYGLGTPEGFNEPPPLFEIVFVESDGAGHPAARVIDAASDSPALPCPAQRP